MFLFRDTNKQFPNKFNEKTTHEPNLDVLKKIKIKRTKIKEEDEECGLSGVVP